MTQVASDSYSKGTETVNKKQTEQGTKKALQSHPVPIVQSRPVNEPTTTKSPSVQSTKEDSDLKKQLEKLAIDSTVIHKKFGKGTVVFPDAFLMGFLKLE